MRKPSRWVLAAVATLLAAVLISSVSDARHHKRAPSQSHPATAARTPLPPIPPSARIPPPAPQTPQVTQAPSPVPQTPPQAPSAAVPTAAPSAKPEPTAIVLDTHDTQAILGKSVRSSAGEDMGRLVDVVVDRNGQPRAAIIDFGGFLGVGSRKIAVDWTALKFVRSDLKGDLVTVELTRDQVKAAPEFKEGSAVVILGTWGSAQAAPANTQNLPKPQENSENPPKTQEK